MSRAVCRLIPIGLELESASNTQASAYWHLSSSDLLSSVQAVSEDERCELCLRCDSD